MDRCVEKSFTAAIVVIGQKFIQDRPFFLQLGKVRLQSQFPSLGNVLLPVPVRDKGIPVAEAIIAGTGVLRAFPAKLDAAVLQGAPGHGAALIACSAAAAGTVAAQVHGAQGAVEATQGEAGFCTGKTFHAVSSLRTTAPALPGTPGFSLGRRGHNDFRCSRIPAKSGSVLLHSNE